MSDIKNHPVLQRTQDFADLCKPLQKINITTFSHAHLTKDNEFSLLGNNPEFLINYTDKQYYNVDIHTQSDVSDLEFLIWDLAGCKGQAENMLKDAAAFNFKHIFTVTEHGENGSDFYHFGTHITDPTIFQFYLNNLDLFKSFIHYFNDKMKESKTIAAAHKIKFKIDTSSHQPLIPQDHPFIITDTEKLDFIQTITQHKVKLSKRQIQCAHWLIKGLTTQEIADKIFLSPRTVEEYISTLKDKFYVTNKAELLVALIGYFHLN